MADQRRTAGFGGRTDAADDIENQIANRTSVLRSGIAARRKITLDDGIGSSTSRACRVDRLIKTFDRRLHPRGGRHDPVVG